MVKQFIFAGNVFSIKESHLENSNEKVFGLYSKDFPRSNLIYFYFLCFLRTFRLKLGKYEMCVRNSCF